MPFLRPISDRYFEDYVEGVAAKQATPVIPVVFPVSGDPIGSRLVTSLARPGGNVTGLSNLGSGLAAKRLELLREVVPDLRRLAVMANVDYSGGLTERDEIDAAARTLGPSLHDSLAYSPESF